VLSAATGLARLLFRVACDFRCPLEVLVRRDQLAAALESNPLHAIVGCKAGSCLSFTPNLAGPKHNVGGYNPWP
jgi:hypothetical protein